MLKKISKEEGKYKNRSGLGGLIIKLLVALGGVLILLHQGAQYSNKTFDPVKAWYNKQLRIATQDYKPKQETNILQHEYKDGKEIYRYFNKEKGIYIDMILPEEKPALPE